MSGPLKKYRYVSPGGSESVLKLSAEDAERHGLTDDDLADAPPTSGEKAAASAPNKARPTSSNKARAPRGKGGEGGGD